jgi:hypothetical protein
MIELAIPIAASAEISGRSAPRMDRRNAKNRTASASTTPRSRLDEPELCSLSSIA